MGARGRLAEFPVSLDVSLSEAQKYRLSSLAADRDDSLAGVVRALIDEKWEQENGCEAPQDGAQAG